MKLVICMAYFCLVFTAWL